MDLRNRWTNDTGQSLVENDLRPDDTEWRGKNFRIFSINEEIEE